METIRVNMTPCEDIKTIHASQNDNEAREWGFELHNNGDKIDSSSISDQLVFKTYEGGTEEILPTNGSTPTTSPFKGDIKYPQGLLSDQEFLYRESPTEEDGLAWIKNIKGNTLVWNQLSPSKAFASSYSKTGLTFVPNDDGSVSISGTVNGTDYNFYVGGIVPVIQGHKYLVKGNSAHFGASYYSSLVAINEYNTGGVIATASATGNAVLYIRGNLTNGASINETIYPQIFDLTQMGLDSLTVDEFTSLFPKPYYAYNQGTLLSFMGNGIKTVGKNLLSYTLQTIRSRNTIGTWTSENTYTLDDIVYTVNSDLSISLKGLTTATGVRSINLQYFTFEDGKQYKINGINSNGDYRINVAGVANYTRESIIDGDGESHDVRIQIRVGASYIDDTIYPMLRYSSVEDGTYEPYVESISSLPISTYFANGMNGHGDTYDELTSTVATKRFEKNSLGDLTWTRRTTNIFSTNLPSEFDASKDISCFMSNRLPTVFVSGYTLAEDGYISIYKTTTVTSSTSIYLNMASQSIDTVADLQTWLSNNPTELVYPLATPTETSFTTASLVTENAEIPLSNEDGVLIGKCTEQLSSESGFFDAKIKLSDEDGECYSNKIQLHIERSPQ